MARNFDLRELIASDTATARKIDNTPNFEICCALDELIDNILQPLRERYGKPIIVNSGYRCATLNKAVGGVSNSQHMKGEAADIQGASRTLAETKALFNLIVGMCLPYDQVIYEHNSRGEYWVHVSYRRAGSRHQIINNLLKK